MALRNVSYSLVSYFIAEKRYIPQLNAVRVCKGKEMVREIPTDEVQSFIDTINADDSFIMGEVAH